MRRSGAWISGIGAISAAGADIRSTLACFAEGTRRFTTSFPFETGVCQPGFIVDAPLPNPGGRHENNRTFRLAMHAVHQALAAADLRSIPSGVRVGICMGTTVGCQLNSLPFYAAYRRAENPPLDRVYDFLSSNLSQAIGKELGVTGPRLTIVNACSSGTDAIGVAASWIRAGLCDIAIAGGADEMYTVPMSGFWSLGVMSTEPCMPFDRDRSGLNLGEGAGIVILESDAFASQRGKEHQFEVAGYGSACDAYHLTAPHPQGRGLQAAIQAALSEANIDPQQVAFINAHGTATLDNDRVEAKVIQKMFGSQAKVLSTKGYTGHTLGAAGALEAVFTLLGLRERWIPASAGFKNRSADLGVSPVAETTSIAGAYALSTSLAFGGSNAALLIRRVDQSATDSRGSRTIPESAQAAKYFGKPLSILGIGAVTPIGRKLSEIASNLSASVDSSAEARRVSDTHLTMEPASAAQLRRADRFTKMAVAAASDAWSDAKSSCVGIAPERIGLFLCSGFGPHCRGFRFLDGIIDSGDTAASPTDFSHSVHGAASAYISRLLDLRGPSLNTTDFEIGFEEAIRVAQCWLNEGTCDRILVGAVEELGAVFEWCAGRMIEANSRITPGEGAIFFMLGRADADHPLRLDSNAIPTEADLVIVEHPVVLPRSVEVPNINARQKSTFTQAFGHSASALAFNVLAAVLAQRSESSIDTAAILRTSSEGRSVTLYLEK